MSARRRDLIRAVAAAAFAAFLLLLLAAAGEIAINPHLYEGRMQNGPQKDLLGISAVTRIPNVLVVNTDVPARMTPPEFARFIAAGSAKFGRIIVEAKVTLEN